jgi:hypothetical protein
MKLGIIVIAVVAVMAAPGLAFYAADFIRYLRRRGNRYRRGVLPAPSPECVAGESWRAFSQQNHRYSGEI